MKYTIARAHLHMWNKLFPKKSLELEHLVPKYILKQIFKDIDENMAGIRELQAEFSKVQVSLRTLQACIY
jgi:hypothetical protein